MLAVVEVWCFFFAQVEILNSTHHTRYLGTSSFEMSHEKLERIRFSWARVMPRESHAYWIKFTALQQIRQLAQGSFIRLGVF